MKKLMNVFFAVLVAFVAIGLNSGEAEARRLGGGSSFGMQRQSLAPRPAPTRQATPATPASPAAAPSPAPKRSWLGPIAGLAAGLGIASLLSHFGLGGEFANILMLALLAMGAVILFKFLFRRQAPASGPMQYAGLGTAPVPPSAATPSFGSPAGVGTMPATVPAGFDSAAFLRIAKLNFVRLQAANDAGNLDDIREFVTPEVFAEIKMQMDERGAAPQQTDVVTLNAELLEVVTEESRHVVSVRFNGMIRESESSAAVPFDEIWNLSKPVDGDKGWVIAGIQQIN